MEIRLLINYKSHPITENCPVYTIIGHIFYWIRMNLLSILTMNLTENWMNSSEFFFLPFKVWFGSKWN